MDDPPRLMFDIPVLASRQGIPLIEDHCSTAKAGHTEWSQRLLALANIAKSLSRRFGAIQPKKSSLILFVLFWMTEHVGLSY